MNIPTETHETHLQLTTPFRISKLPNKMPCECTKAMFALLNGLLQTFLT